MRNFRTMGMSASVICFALVVGSTVTHAQRSVTLTGVVRDSASGEVLPHARVTIPELRRTTETNADGRFAIVGVPRASLALEVRYIGYRADRRTIRSDSLSTPVTILLVRAAHQLATATVTASAPEGVTAEIGPTVSRVSISTAQVEAMPSVGEVDVFRTLQMLPSVSGASDGTASLSVRGGTADQNLVLLDGMTVYHVDHFFGLFSAFNADALKDIQFYAGGFPARYGGRLSSVVDLTGKAGDERTMRASGGLNFLSGRGVLEIPLGRGSWLVSARRSYSDLIRSPLYNRLFDFAGGQSTAPTQPRSGGPGGARFQTQEIQPSFYFYDLNSKLTYRPSSKDVATLSLYSGRDNLDQSQDLGGFPGPGGTTGTAPSLTDFTSWGNVGVSGRWFRQWAGRMSSDALIAASRYTSDGERTTSGGTPAGARFNFGYTEANAVHDVSLRLDNELQVASWSRVAFGGGVTRNRVSYDFIVDATDTTQNGRNTSRDGDAVLTAAYAQHTWTPIAAVDITTGLRASQYDATHETYVEPRVSLGLQLSASLRLKGAWGKYHQFVTRAENEDVLQGSRDFWILADSALEPSAAEHRIVGLTFDRSAWSLNVEAYDKTLTGISLFSRRYRQSVGINTGAFFFTGNGRARGIETLLQKKRGALTGWLSYTLAEARDRYDDIDGGREFPSALDQRHEAKGFGAYSMGKWEIAATALYGSGRPYTAPLSQYELELLDGTTQTYVHVGTKNGARLPTYQRADLAISRRWESDAMEWKIGLSLYNITNRRNVSYRKFDLSQSPMLITDVAQLGFTPSIDVKFSLRELKTIVGGNR